MTQALTTAHVPYQLQDNGSDGRSSRSRTSTRSGSASPRRVFPRAGRSPSRRSHRPGSPRRSSCRTSTTNKRSKDSSPRRSSRSRASRPRRSRLSCPTRAALRSATPRPRRPRCSSTSRTGTTLSVEQVQGIVHLVASSVPSLDASNVTVVDDNGNVLSAPGVDASAEQRQRADRPPTTASSPRRSPRSSRGSSARTTPPSRCTRC